MPTKEQLEGTIKTMKSDYADVKEVAFDRGRKLTSLEKVICQKEEDIRKLTDTIECDFLRHKRTDHLMALRRAGFSGAEIIELETNRML